ncbi:MAG: cytochrome-c peroxidase [Bdellovibrionales bacterium]
MHQDLGLGADKSMMGNYKISLFVKRVLIPAFFLLSPTVARGQDAAPLSGEPILPLPLQAPGADQAKIQLGHLLFHEQRLSKNNSVSCASCHALELGGADHKQFSVGFNGQLGGLNTPTVLNSSLNFKQFWDGRANTLEDQIDGPVLNAKEMGSTWSEVLEKLRSDEKYVLLFKNIYQAEIAPAHIKDAIAHFERSLITPNSRFDQYLRGNKTAMSAKEVEGYRKFKSFGCVSCHQGMNIGGNMFQTMGVMGNYFKDQKRAITENDLGRYNVTKKERDKHVFRVPSLRNVALTAPYFHDGSAQTLDQAVNVMARYQLGRQLSKVEVEQIVAFLESLTGQKPTRPPLATTLKSATK